MEDIKCAEKEKPTVGKTSRAPPSGENSLELLPPNRWFYNNIADAFILVFFQSKLDWLFLSNDSKTAAVTS